MGDYLHIFNSTSDFTAAYYGRDYNEPWVSVTLPNEDVAYNKRMTPANNHGGVDLGLPSRTIWAQCNVGAHNPQDYGDLFAWGDVLSARTAYGWSSYVHGTSNALTKYNATDGLTVLEAQDDAAFVTMGGNWHIPTAAQFDELIAGTNLSTGVTGGINCIYLTSKVNGNVLTIPMSGIWNNDWGQSSRTSAGEGGAFWSVNLSTTKTDAKDVAYNVTGDGIAPATLVRPAGIAVRAVYTPGANSGHFSRWFGISKILYNDNGTLNTRDHYCVITDDNLGKTCAVRLIKEDGVDSIVYKATDTAHDCVTTGMTHNSGDWIMYHYLNGNWNECKVQMTNNTGETTYTSGGSSYRLVYTEIHTLDGNNRTLYCILKKYKANVLIEDYVNLIWGATQVLDNLKYMSPAWNDNMYDPNYGVCEVVRLMNGSKYYI